MGAARARTWPEVTAYAKARNVAIMAWGKVANRTSCSTPDRAEAWMAKLEKLGIRGAKIDFFDQRDTTAEKTDDLEDTQARLQRARLALGDGGPAPPDGRVPRLRRSPRANGGAGRT